MGGLKKGKSSGKSKGKGKESRKEPKKVQDDHQRDSLLPLQERVAAVKPFWELLSQQERVKILTVSVEDLKERAADLAEQQRKQAVAEQQMYPEDTITIDLEPSIEELLEIGVGRLKEKSAWKLWQWLADDKEFLDADSFRGYMENEHIEDSLRALLPKDEGKPVEKPAEAALRTRMSDLLQRVHQHNRQMQEEPYNGRRARAPRATPDQVGAAMRDTNIELINIIMEALEQEHEFLYHAVLFPITSCICEMLEEGSRESNCMDLCYEDLEKLHPDEVARICEWLTEKLDGFSSKIKPEAKDIEEEEEEEEGIGDVDLFTLSDDHQTLTVNAKWLQHLQERVLGTDGQPRKTKDGEDPFNMGLVLEWVFGTIVSTAEKARDGAKRTLGTRPPTATQAHDQLVQALREQQNWEKRAKDAKELLNRMLKSRKETADFAQQHDIKALAMRPAAGVDAPTAEPPELPDHVIVAMLHREILLTEAKLHALDYELVTSDRKLRQLRSQLRQGEPEFERLKRELEEVKNQPRGLEGTFRSAAEMERHRAQMADAAIEEQLEVQTAFREHGARLQGIYDKRQRTEMDIARKEQEIKQLKGWRTTVQSLIDRCDELIVSPLPPPGTEGAATGAPADESKGEAPADEAAAAHRQALEAATRSLTGHDMALAKLRSHFQKDVRRQLYGDDDDKTFFDWIRQELRSVEKGLEDGRAVLHHLEMFLVNVACNDPGAAIGAHLVLPLLQERLDAKALEFAAQRAAAAEEAIIKMEEEKAERARQEREKRQKMKQKAKDKVRTEKERMLAERDAKLEAERAVLEETRRALLEKEEEVKKQKLEEIEKRRQEEEAQMEARRRELLSEEDGYWRRRMAQEVQTQALQEESIVKANPQAEEGPADSSASDQSTWKDDNDGFRDTAKGPRRSRNLKQRPQPDMVIERPANGYSKANGRIEDGRYPRQMREHEQPRENGHRERRRLPSVQDAGTLPVRELKPSRSSSTLSEKQSEKSRSGRASPQLNELSKTRSAESTGSATLPLRPRAVPAEPTQQPAVERPKPTIAGRDPPQPAGKQPVSPLPGDKTSTGSTAALEPVKAAVPAVSAPAPAAAVPSQEPAAVQADAHQIEEPPAPIFAAPPMLPDTQEAPQEQEPDASVPSSTASSNGPELAPGTPAQQPPPVPMLVPTPSVADGMPPPHHPGGGVIFMQGMHAQQPGRNPAPHGIHQGQVGGAGMAPPSEAPHGAARNHPVRREGMHYTGPQNGPVPQGMMNGPVPLQPRRPQIAQARSTELGMHPSQAYQRGFPRGSQQPPPPASGVQFPGQPMMGPPPVPASADSAELPASGPPMIIHAGGPVMGQPGSGAPPAASGPPMMYPGHPRPPPQQGSQPMPQHVFVGNMVTPAFGMPSMGQIPIMNGPPGGPPNGHLQHAGDSPPHPSHMFPAFGGSPTRMGLRPAYSRGSPPPPVPGFQRQPGNTTLRANAPSFVPGGSSFRPSPPSHQPQLPRRPMSDQRRRSDDRGMFMGPGMSRPASSDMMHSSSGNLPQRSAETEPAPADAAAPGMVPSLVQPAVPEVKPQPAQEPALEPDNTACSTEKAVESSSRDAEPSSRAVEAEQSEAQPETGSASQPSRTGSSALDAPQPSPHQQPQQLPQPQQQAQDAEASSSDNAAAPQHILTRPQPVPPPKGSGAASSAPPPKPLASQPGAASNTNTASQQGPPKQQPKWSAVAAMDRQATHGQAGTSSSGGGPLPLRKEGSGDVLRGSSPSARSEPSKRQASGSSSNLRKSGSGNQLGTARTSGSTRTAGDKRKITRAGGVTWEGLQDEYDRLKLVRGLSNEAGRNNCFLNVIIQSLWHLRSFREALLAMQPQALEARGSPPEDVRVLRALWNIFNAFNQPREELSPADGSDGSSPPQTSGNGEEADAKRAKREGQEDAAAAKVSKGWTVSPAELREALSSISHAALRFDLTDMHDAAEVLDKIFSSLHRAEVGQPAEGELDAALPQRVRVPAPGAPPSCHQNGSSLPRRGPSSLVESLFGMDVQVPSPPDDEEDTLAIKRSKGTGGAVVGRWQETTARSRPQGGSPKATAKPAGPRKPKDPSVVEMLQYIKLYHLVPAQGLKVAYDHLIGSQFEEVLKEADVAEQHLAQSGANGGLHQSVAGRAVKTSDIILLKRPRIFNLAIGWESAQAPADVINATIDALAPQVDPAGVFKSAPRGPGYQLRCIVCYFGHHYKAYALSEELNEWLLFDDSTISHIGGWRDVTASLRGSRLQPNLLFYEQQA